MRPRGMLSWKFSGFDHTIAAIQRTCSTIFRLHQPSHAHLPNADHAHQKPTNAITAKQVNKKDQSGTVTSHTLEKTKETKTSVPTTIPRMDARLATRTSTYTRAICVGVAKTTTVCLDTDTDRPGPHRKRNDGQASPQWAATDGTVLPNHLVNDIAHCLPMRVVHQEHATYFEPRATRTMGLTFVGAFPTYGGAAASTWHQRVCPVDSGATLVNHVTSFPTAPVAVLGVADLSQRDDHDMQAVKELSGVRDLCGDMGAMMENKPWAYVSILSVRNKHLSHRLRRLHGSQLSR